MKFLLPSIQLNNENFHASIFERMHFVVHTKKNHKFINMFLLLKVNKNPIIKLRSFGQNLLENYTKASCHMNNYTNQCDGELVETKNHFFHTKFGKNNFGMVHLVIDDRRVLLFRLD
jgi:hypothetical protein